MKSDNKQKQLSQEQIKQLMAMMKNQKPVSKYRKALNTVFGVFSKTISTCVVFIDRFIKFIIKKDDIDREDVVQTARGPILFGTYVIVIFVVFGGLWSVIAPLDSAAVAVGTVIPSTKKRMVQHQQGGIIKNVYVKVGDKVKEGDKIIELDEVIRKSEYESALNEYRVALASFNRLEAERDMKDDITFNEFLTEGENDIEVTNLLKTQTDIFKSNKMLYEKRIEAQEQKYKQLENQLVSTRAILKSAKKTRDVRKEQLNSFEQLFKSENLQRSKLLESEAQYQSSESEVARFESDISKVKEAMLEEEANKFSFISDFKSRIVQQLSDMHRQKNSLKERYLATKDGFERVIVRSSVDGTVIELFQTSIGGVVPPSQPIAEILPENDRLIVEAKIPSRNIDSVNVGLNAKIRFSAFKSRTTPVFNGIVTSLSPDTITQQNPQEEPFYIARIEINMEEFNTIAKRNKLTLRPGMQAEVQIVTGTRTLFQYLISPVTDNMFKAFVEK